jgi:uncharacterized membrane protein
LGGALKPGSVGLTEWQGTQRWSMISCTWAPSNGVVLQSLDQVLAHLPQVQQQLALRTMPLGNLTKMTDDERATVLMWIGHGMSR